MHRLIKTTTIAGVLATSLPLLIGTANALTPNAWNPITPYRCQSYSFQNNNGEIQTTLNISATDGTFLNVFESPVTSTILRYCAQGSTFLAWYDPSQRYWTEFYFYPGQSVVGAPLTVGWNRIKPTSCFTTQGIDDSGIPFPGGDFWVSTPYFGLLVKDSRDIDAIAGVCGDGIEAIYGYSDGVNYTMNNFQFYAGLR
jgi:hypothetical protein